MAGFCGAIGDGRGLESMCDDLRRTGAERVFSTSDGDVAAASVVHPFDADLAFAESADGSLTVHLWGSVWGVDRGTGYESVPESGAECCLSAFERYGRDFAARLNGNFVGGVVDREAGRVHLFTDRLSTRPLYVAPVDGGVVFSTAIQSLPLHPAVDTEFDPGYVGEYLTLKRVFGVRTPLAGVEQLLPGSVTTVDASDGSVETSRYWEPVYDPGDASAAAVARQLARAVRAVVADRTDREGDYGLLLSGGSDSRLVLAACVSLGVPVRTYHLSDWRNREARVAERVADAAGVDFALLERDRDYQKRALATQPALSNFVGFFNQAHAAGFAETLTDEDVLLSGHYGDMLFKGNHLARPTVDLGPLGSFELPTERRVTSLEAFVESRLEPEPAYLDLPRSVESVYRDEVERRGERVVDHGVEYRSIREATLASRCPLTNGTSQFFYDGTAQMMPAGTPFLDNRLIDLFLSIPIRHLLRGDLINRATTYLAPELAEVEHGTGAVPVGYPYAVQWAGEIALGFAQRHLHDDPPEPHWSHGPWTDHGELLRTHDYVRDALAENEARVRSLPFLRWEGVVDCYESHLDGEENVAPLYTLATFLRMPIHDRLRDGTADGGGSDRRKLGPESRDATLK